jgi:TRAP-type C4-dicarboxylate transport system substrate-binding protein
MRAAVKEAIAFQRALAVEEDRDARRAIESEGCDIVELTLGQHAAFAAAVLPLLDEASETYGKAAMRLVGHR